MLEVTKEKYCQNCLYYEIAALFELCKHEASKYKIAEREDWHTIGHMTNLHGKCSPELSLFEEIKEL